MIRTLTLSNWRAYQHLELTLDTGTTFIVAPNGVGKTSIVLAFGWVLFGDEAGISGVECIRAGAERTEITLTMALRAGRTLKLARSRGLKGRETVTYHVDDRKITNADGVEVLEEEFGVSLPIAARLCMMRSTDNSGGDALDLRDHLYRAFGVADVLAAKEEAKQQLNAARNARKQLVSTAKETEGDTASVTEELKDLETTIGGLDQERGRLQRGIGQHEEWLANLHAWQIYDLAVADREEAIQRLASSAAALGAPSPTRAIEPAIDEIVEQATAAAAEAEHKHTTTAGRAAAARHALDLLNGVDAAAKCPTCLREFEAGDLDHARTTLRSTEQATLAESTAASSDLDDHRAHLRDTETLRAQARALPPAPTPPTADKVEPDDEPPGFDQLVEQLERLITQRAELDQRHRHLSNQLAEFEQAAAIQDNLIEAHRREALAEAAHLTLSDTADRLTQERIDPLANEVRWRWKRLFGDDGLTLRPDGSIVRVIGDRELGWDALSGGEKIWARLVTHLLVLSASTTLPFAWFDEPLEHLDPRTRRAVAASLASASKAGGPAQLVITTYEHAIARQLAVGSEHTAIKYVRAKELV